MPQFYDPWPLWSQQQGTGYYPGYYPTNIIPQQQVWNAWNYQPTSITAGTSGMTFPDPWQWQTGGTQVQNTIWIDWCNQPVTVTPLVGFGGSLIAPVELTPKQESAAARNRIVVSNRARARGLRQKIAARKANQLLLDFLDETQREEWVKDRAFHVHTADGLRTYRIAYGLAGNVRLVKADGKTLDKYGRPLRRGSRFCCHVYHPDGQVPHEDNVLTQKLLLEADEAQFLAMANVS